MDRFKSQMPTAILASLVGALLLTSCAAVQDVKVVNAPTAPVPVRDVDETAREPMHAGIDLKIKDQTGCSPLTVPAKKRLVIEHISARLFITPSGKKGDLSTFHKTNGVGLTHYHLPTFLALQNELFGVNGDAYIVSEPTKLYVDPGTEFYACAFGNLATVTGDVAVSGYFVNVP